ncbi:VRR-NUC domain-containing protein [Azospirillum canadense]|uniref:VRR-NUC domain-containing protein n=1 Tax=Azospirillum canadense TaxID=403962 RepID=UPI0022262060|nr:VRR-NUC domain-containing protein [Azospirillum canadense]MCW2242199.1 hypothetical protein [Azospirillum canadense]
MSRRAIPLASLGPGALRQVSAFLTAERVQSEMRAAPKQRPEEQFHIGVANHLEIVLPVDAWFCHVPNGGKRSKAEAARLKAMGTKAGTPDIEIVYQGRSYWIELKSASGSLSKAQKDCHADLRRAGAPVATARTLEEVETALRGWGIPLRGSVQGVAA